MQDTRLPKVSIIIPCYNSAKTLKQCIESIYAQTYSNVECVIIDGASTDNTINIIQEYEKAFHAKNFGYVWISEADSGIYEAMNKGIKAASGDLIGVLGSDDWYEPNALKSIISEYIKDPSADLIYGFVKFYRNELPMRIEQIYETELPRKNLHHQGIIYKKELHDKYGYYSTTYRVGGDYDFLLKCYLHHCKFSRVNDLIANFRHGGTSHKLSYIAGLDEANIKYIHKVINLKTYFRLRIKIILLELFGWFRDNP